VTPRLIAALVAIAMLFAAGFFSGKHWVQGDWDAEKAERVAHALEASQEARRIEQARAAKVQEVQSGYAKETAAATAAARGARDELGRVRDAIATAGTPVDAATAVRADDSARARFVVGQCAGALSEMAAVADACEARLSALQGWARAVTQPP
jgi:hypothetical protein